MEQEAMRQIILEGRLDTLIRGWGYATKNEISKLCAEQRITVNGIPAPNRGITCERDAVIRIDDKVLIPKPFMSVMLNKPGKYACMNGDIRYPSVTAIFGDSGPEHSLFPVGRLDVDTEGFLVMTNNGALSTYITDPENAVRKTYYAEYDRPLTEEQLEPLRQGARFFNGTDYRPAEIHVISPHSAEITVTEGKYHEVKRMIRTCGSMVTYLKRIAIGDLKLDEKLAPGEYRVLNEDEIKMMFR